jgi:6-phosphofructokinase 1
MELTTDKAQIASLGDAKIRSPLAAPTEEEKPQSYVDDNTQILCNIKTEEILKAQQAGEPILTLELAGARRQIYFDPSKLRCALVTCGGLCPGLNDIIRAIVLELYYHYGVRNIYGIRYGLEGFIPEYGHDWLDLDPALVSGILDKGGSILGSSRGAQDIEAIVDCLERLNIGILFMIGGDGTLKAAHKITAAVAERKLKISVIGIPKTIDNDIYMVSRSFGFDTAVEVSTEAIIGAHNEARGYPNGIGLIKLMGRHSGFIAATAALAQQDVNFALIPEVDFDLEGECGLLASLERRLKERGHAVIVAAEGAGQKFFEDAGSETDASGNIRLKDIGLYLKSQIKEYFDAKGIKTSLKYIDPSYMIRSLPANANDSVFCGFLGRDAVHAGMAGKTDMIIGHWNNHFVHIPMTLSVGNRKQVNPHGKLWTTVLESTGQGALRNNCRHKGLS